MRAYLVQHGEARSKEEDPERRLTQRGVRDVEKVAAFIKPLGLSVTAIRQSGKTRATQSAEILATAVPAADGVVERDGLGPTDSVTAIARELNQSDADVMLVGHMPFMDKLASLLVAGSEDAGVVAFRNGGIVCLEREQETWRVAWIVPPELLP